jgi:hypothetical protein
MQIANSAVIDGNEGIGRLYSLGGNQWVATEEIDWSQEHVLPPDLAEVSPGLARGYLIGLFSRFFYGEQLAAGICGQLIGMLAEPDAKMFLTTQVMDEGRHMEVFARLAAPLGGLAECPAALAEFMRRLYATKSVEVKVSAMLFIEAGAARAFKFLQANDRSPLLNQALTYIMRDEGRHLSFDELFVTSRLPQLSVAARADVEAELRTLWPLWIEGTHAEPATVAHFAARLTGTKKDAYDRWIAHHRSYSEQCTTRMRQAMSEVGFSLD